MPASPSPSQADRAAAPRVAEPDASGAPRIRSFNVNTAPLGGRRSRVTFLHTTQAPICGCGAPDGGSIGFAAPGLANGGQTFPTEVLGAAYGLLVSPAPLRPSNFKPLARFELTLQGDLSSAVVLVGRVPARTLALITLHCPRRRSRLADLSSGAPRRSPS